MAARGSFGACLLFQRGFPSCVVVSVDFSEKELEIGNHTVHASFFKAGKCLLSGVSLKVVSFDAQTLCKWCILFLGVNM